jgi:DNA-binding LytR/AlgR family response regulator
MENSHGILSSYISFLCVLIAPTPPNPRYLSFINGKKHSKKIIPDAIAQKSLTNMFRELIEESSESYQEIPVIETNTSGAGQLLHDRLCLPTQKGFTIIKLDDIIYCEAQRSYTNFRLTDNKRIMISRPLFDYDKLLSDTIFLRVHRSFLVNLMHVKEYVRGEGGTVVMTNGMEIEVSRRKKELFISRIRESFKTV